MYIFVYIRIHIYLCEVLGYRFGGVLGFIGIYVYIYIYTHTHNVCMYLCICMHIYICVKYLDIAVGGVLGFIRV